MTSCPLSILPKIVKPWSFILSRIGSLKGSSALLLGIGKFSKISNKVGPLYQFPFSLLTGTIMLSPVIPDIGTHSMSFSMLNLQDSAKNGVISFLICSYLSWLQFTEGSSILFTIITSLVTPKDFANIACSRVCPPLSNPVSNSEILAEMTNPAYSACEAPEIMLGT